MSPFHFVLGVAGVFFRAIANLYIWLTVLDVADFGWKFLQTVRLLQTDVVCQLGQHATVNDIHADQLGCVGFGPVIVIGPMGFGAFWVPDPLILMFS